MEKTSFLEPFPGQVHKWTVIVITALFALWVGKEIGVGNIHMATNVMMIGGVIVVMHLLGRRFWMLTIFGMMFPFALPVTFYGRNFSADEGMSMAVIACAAVQVALRRFTVRIFEKQLVPAILFIGWMVVVFCANPVGLAIFGGNIMGARWYFQIALAFGAYVILANSMIQRVDIKWIFAIMAFNALASIVYQSWNYWTTHLGNYNPFEAVGSLGYLMLLLLLARYSLDDIFSLRMFWAWLLYLLCAILMFSSGKRFGVATFIMLPLFAAILRGKIRYAVIMFLLAAMMAGVLVMGHGRLFRLPDIAQRGFSWLPGRWDSAEAKSLGTSDIYRAAMRKIAIEQIKKRPIIGRGFTIDAEEVYLDQMMLGGGALEGATASTAYASGSYHNLWLGIGAELGIPAIFFFAAILLQAVRNSWWVAHATSLGDAYNMYGAFAFFTMCPMILASWIGGGSMSFTRLLPFAILFPILKALKQEMPQQAMDGVPSARAGAGGEGFERII